MSFGGAEAKSFEQSLMYIAEWLIDNPSPCWFKELDIANKLMHVQSFNY